MLSASIVSFPVFYLLVFAFLLYFLFHSLKGNLFYRHVNNVVTLVICNFMAEKCKLVKLINEYLFFLLCSFRNLNRELDIIPKSVNN